MKAIGKLVYENLSTEQRARAVVAAAAREDYAEVDKLRDTCPRDTRWSFADRMRRLWCLSVAMECDLREMTIRFLQTAYRAEGVSEDETQTLKEIIDVTDGILRDIAGVVEAFTQVAARLGVDADEVVQAGVNHNHVTQMLVERARSHYTPDPEFLDEALRIMEEQLGIRT